MQHDHKVGKGIMLGTRIPKTQAAKLSRRISELETTRCGYLRRLVVEDLNREND